MVGINVINQMNEMKKILSYSKNVGFFFGAGTSCAFGLPNIINLTTETKARLAAESIVTFAKTEDLVKDLTKNKNVSVENILNHVRQIRDITRGRNDLLYYGISGEHAEKLDIDICEKIFDIINEKENAADITDVRRFFAWYDSTNRNYVKEIFTTNYDMLLEMAMEANYIPYFDGFTGSYEPFFNPESIECFPKVSDSTGKWIRLWKIHGSLNWSLKPATATRSERIIREGKFDKPQNELMIYPSKEKYNLSRKEPYIAYFDRLKNYLLQGELLFICSGYSFSDQHINDIIFNALHQNNRLYIAVFCFDDEQVVNMEKYAAAYLNLCVMGPTKAISNGRLCDWNFDDSEDEKDGCEFYWDETKNEFILGDFKKLIDFLIENSGKKSSIEEVLNAR